VERLPRRLAESRYVLEEVLGEGGMAIVYRGRDEGLSVDRAIKVLDPGMTSGGLRRRFILEAKTMAGLDHPHLVKVHDVHADDPVFLVMELMAGSVHRWLGAHGPMPPRMAVEVTRSVLKGLAHAHARGIVHRDVKPQNVLISTDGVAKLTDFGIARVDSARSLTRTGAVMGTYAYMPPEQRASAKHVDARADVYATGAMLYALVTNEEPFDLFASESHAARFEGVPEGLRSVIVAACRYEPSDRFENAEAMEKALEVASAELPEVPEGTPALWRCGLRRRATTIEEVSIDASIDIANPTWQPRLETEAGALTEPEPSTQPPVTQPPVEHTPRGPIVAGIALLIGVAGVVGWNVQNRPEPVTVVVEDLPEPPDAEVALDPPPLEVIEEDPPTVEEDPPVVDEVLEKAPPVDVAVAELDPVEVEDPPVEEVVVPVMLTVNTQPWGHVTVDGSRRRTPWIDEVDSGGQALLLESSDNRTKTLTVDVPADAEFVFCWDFNLDAECRGGP